MEEFTACPAGQPLCGGSTSPERKEPLPPRKPLLHRWLPPRSAPLIFFFFSTLKISRIASLLFLAFSAWSTVLAQSGNPRFKIEADVIGGLSGESNSTRFSNFGVNEPISGLSLKNLPDIENFAGFAGQIVALDQDMDGLPDHQEITLGTDKTKADTDGDGLTDKEEVDSGTNPLLADTDGDGYSDMAEINANTNPLLSSSNPNQAPTDLNTTAPLTLAENQPVGTVVGEFNGTDPDANSTLIYSLASGNGDHNNSLFSLDTNGTLTSLVMFDFESNASTYSILVGVKDEYNASLEKTFTVSLTNVIEDLDGDGVEDAFDPDMDGDGFSNTVEMAYGSDPLDFNSRANQSPTNLELNGNTISENQAMGTEIGVFNALDTDTHAVLSFTFVNGSGESNNSLFTLEQNGTLTSAVIFDYESTASPLTINVRASDEYNASTEGNFTINLTNVFEDFDEDGIEDAIDPDTDGDGFSNTVEIAQGTDPLDPTSIPNALPLFEHNQSLTIAENLPVGTVVGQLLGSDPDGHSLTYKLAGGLPTSPGLSTVGHNAYGHTLFVGSGGSLWANSTASDSYNSNDNSSSSNSGSSFDPDYPPKTWNLASASNLEMIWVEPGTFMMGSPTTEAGRSSDETQHNVTLNEGFYLGKYEVTQAQYEAVMTGNSDGFHAE